MSSSQDHAPTAVATQGTTALRPAWEALRALSEKATPGPWSAVNEESYDVSGWRIPNVFDPTCCCCGATGLTEENANFVVGAASAVREALASPPPPDLASDLLRERLRSSVLLEALKPLAAIPTTDAYGNEWADDFVIFRAFGADITAANARSARKAIEEATR